MKLYSYYRSSCAWRVRLALAHKGIEYEYVAVNIHPDVSAQRESNFSVINDMRQVPVLEIGEPPSMLRLTQSVAICEYLEELFPQHPLLPSEPVRRARVREMTEIVASGIQPLQNMSVTHALRNLGGERAAQSFAASTIARGLTAFEKRAADCGGSYSAGDSVTLADMFLLPQLYNARRFAVDMSAWPRLLDIEARCAGLPAFIAAHPNQQPDATPLVESIP